MAAMPTRLMPCMPPHCVLAPLVCCRRGRVRGAPQGTAVPCRRACQLAGLRCRSRRLGGWGAWVLRPAQPLPAGLPMCPHLRSIRTTTLCCPSTSAGGWGSVSGQPCPPPLSCPCSCLIGRQRFLSMRCWRRHLPLHRRPRTLAWLAGGLAGCRYAATAGNEGESIPLAPSGSRSPLPTEFSRQLAGACVAVWLPACLPGMMPCSCCVPAYVCLPGCRTLR